MEKKSEFKFFEVYKTLDKHGYGTVLIYHSPKKFEHVMFQGIDSPKKVIFNKDLLDLYNKTE